MAAEEQQEQQQEQPKQGDDFVCNIWCNSSLDVTYIEDMKNGDQTFDVFKIKPNVTIHCVRSDDKKCVRLIWRLSNGIKTLKTMVLGNIHWKDEGSRFDDITIFDNYYPSNKGLDADNQTFGETIIAADGLNNRSMYAMIHWVGDGGHIDYECTEYEYDSVFSNAITEGTGILGNIHGEYLCVGGSDGFEPIKSTNPAISDASKKYVFQVIKCNKEGEWEVLQQDFLPDGWGAETAKLWFDGDQNEHAICACTDQGDGAILAFDRSDNGKYKCTYVDDIYHEQHYPTVAGKQIRHIQNGLRGSQLLVALSYIGQLKICDLLLLDSYYNKKYSVPLPSEHKHNITSLELFNHRRGNYYTATFGLGCCDYVQATIELCTWDQKRLIFIAMYKNQPKNCFLQYLLMDLVREIFKFTGHHKSNAFFRPPLPLPSTTTNEYDENNDTQGPSAAETQHHEKTSNTTPNKPQ